MILVRPVIGKHVQKGRKESEGARGLLLMGGLKVAGMILQGLFASWILSMDRAGLNSRLTLRLVGTAPVP